MPAWNDPEQWRRLCAGDACPICLRGRPLDVIAELACSDLTATEQACLKGQCCLVYRRHAVELHDLSDAEAGTFLHDLRRVSAALKQVTGAAKLNLELHGNTIPHLHAHLFPRHPGDRFDGRPINPSEREPPVYAAGEFSLFVKALREAMGRKL